MAQEILQYATTAEGINFVISQAASGVDLTTVTAASVQVKLPDATFATWAASIASASPTSLTLTHMFLAHETDQTGEYHPLATLTTPGGPIRAKLARFTVVDGFL